MDAITQRNAVLVEEATSVTDAVDSQTALLDAAVGVFNVPRRSARADRGSRSASLDRLRRAS